MLTAFGGSIPSLAIFNQFNIVNRPILFNWQNANEKWKIITKFENQTLAQIKYSCSGQINGKMYIFGGQPDRVVATSPNFFFNFFFHFFFSLFFILFQIEMTV